MKDYNRWTTNTTPGGLGYPNFEEALQAIRGLGVGTMAYGYLLEACIVSLFEEVARLREERRMKP